MKSIILAAVTAMLFLSGAEAQIGPGADLRGRNLEGRDLSFLDLRGADLRGAKLRGALLLGTDLRGSDLRGADLALANMTAASVAGADVSGADFREANLDGVEICAGMGVSALLYLFHPSSNLTTAEGWECGAAADLSTILSSTGTDGDGDAPAVVTPPAPPPAPPPFQPQAVEVALGSSGTTVTLMTTEAGGFTLNSEAFTGGEVIATNGSRYTLTLAGGLWSAAYNAVSVEVPLGAFGGTVTVTSRETGGYTLPDGTVVGAGATYWSSANRGTYAVMLGADGQPTAVFVATVVTVRLGALGGSIALARQEDGVTFLGPDGRAVRSGDIITRGANRYVLRFVAGVWSATLLPSQP